MPKKKRVYSTKGRKVESEPKIDEIIDEESGLNESENESINIDDRLTVDEAIAWFAKKPHEEEFISLDKAGTAIACGNLYIQFKNGKLRTSDPAVVKALLKANAVGARYGIHFVGLNPKLRNLK